ncbi:hypothetical protein EVAR_99296_1 [Eumeta japonica]|uniref:Uncharacterized protein n=1 Tax=Eumeta variegata TaxID=151549 RepID=A0A4C2A3C9_EUMVA|nr:hypothetical protein EVAR_99296_1 [Eumeta japonica]
MVIPNGGDKAIYHARESIPRRALAHRVTLRTFALSTATGTGANILRVIPEEECVNYIFCTGYDSDIATSFPCTLLA